jgi:hypothetical protein
MSDDIFKFDLNFEGIDDVCNNLDLYDEKAVKAATHAMVENAEALLGKSMRIVPHDKGMLEGSGSAKVQNEEIAHGTDDGKMIQTGKAPSVRPGAVITGTVSYNKPYAARQHEELSYEHKEGRQAKYLEQPLREFVRQFAQNIADAVKGVRR